MSPPNPLFGNYPVKASESTTPEFLLRGQNFYVTTEMCFVIFELISKDSLNSL